MFDLKTFQTHYGKTVMKKTHYFIYLNGYNHWTFPIASVSKTTKRFGW